MRTLIVALLAVSTVFAFPQGDQPAGGCPGGYSEGAEIERSRLVYVCQGGRVLPKACIAEDLSRIPVGGKYDNTHYRRACQTRGEDLTFEATSCIQNGQEHKPGETWEADNQVYTCKSYKDEPVLDAVSTGCAAEGKRLNPGEQVPKGDVLLECTPSVNNKFKLVPNGCNKDGKQLKVGEALEVGKFWFNCSKYGRETVSLRIAGCLNNGHRLNDGDRFNDNDVMYECLVSATKNDIRAVACMQNDNGNVVERKLGCTWVEGTEPFQYQYQCRYDAAANTATRVQLKCNYKVGSGYHQIEPGCYRVIDNAAFGCVNQGKTLNLQSFQGQDAEKSAQAAGLHSC